MKYHLFPKFFRHLSLEDMMERCSNASLDGAVALVRDGYWIERKTLAKDLTKYTAVAEKAGMDVSFAFTDIPIEELIRDDSPLRIIADGGIRTVRLGIIGRNAAGHVREIHDYSRKLVGDICRIVEKLSIRAVIQLHGVVGIHTDTEGCHPHNATAAWHLVRDLDPAHISIMIDPGNNYHQEGYECFDYQIRLLGEYIGAVGTKDACILRSGPKDSPSKGWEPHFVPCYEGQANWYDIYSELRRIGFDGPMILMPFYNQDNFQKLYTRFLREIEYLRQIERQVIS